MFITLTVFQLIKLLIVCVPLAEVQLHIFINRLFPVEE